MNNQARCLQNSTHERSRQVADPDVQADEIHRLRDSVRRLLADKEELCDLCCFLDDDRQRYRRDAVEWQKLHQQMATEITKKMADLQSKLSELEKSQSELVMENASLKDLCLYLNEQREQSAPVYDTGAAFSRDSGDGSSGSSQSVDKLVSAVHESEISPSLNDALLKCQQPTKDECFACLKSRLTNKEENSSHVCKYQRFAPRHMRPISAEADCRTFALTAEPVADNSHTLPWLSDCVSPSHLQSSSSNNIPDAIKVIRVHESVESSAAGSQLLDDTEKSLINGMCNVVWRKLGDSVPGYKTVV